MISFVPNLLLIVPVGFTIGVLIALPTGPTNLLGLQRAVERGFFGGVAAGIGILLGDGLLALIAALGVNAISGAVRLYRTAIQIVGGLALMGAGLVLYFSKPRFTSVQDAASATLGDYIWDIPKLFLITITNPTAVLGLLAIFSGVSSFVEVDSYLDAFTMVASVMGGSLTYWIVVSRLISSIRHGLDEERMARINQVAGMILIGFGALLIGEMSMKTWHA
jgi:threonine/homoserine/homoserine lactone efflux protein